MDDLTALFAEVGLEKYADQLIKEGVDDVEMLGELTQEDLQEMGIPRIRARSALKKIAALEAASSAPSGRNNEDEEKMPTDYVAAAKANACWSHLTLPQKEHLITAYENVRTLALVLREITGNAKFLCTLSANEALLQPDEYPEKLLGHWREAFQHDTPSRLQERIREPGNPSASVGDPNGFTISMLSYLGNRKLDREGIKKNAPFSQVVHAVEKACETELRKENFNDTFDHFHWCWDHPENGGRLVNGRSYHLGRTMVFIVNDHAPVSYGCLQYINVLNACIRVGGPAREPRCFDSSASEVDKNKWKPVKGFEY